MRRSFSFENQNPFGIRFDSEFFRLVPAGPGVYRMLSDQGEILYVGKAKCLRDRLRSYRHAHGVPEVSRKTIRLLHEVRTIEWEVADTEREALIRECELLRSLQPRFNVLLPRPEFYGYVEVLCSEAGVEVRWSYQKKCLRGGMLFGAFRGRRLLSQTLPALARLEWIRKSAAEANALDLPSHLRRDYFPPETFLQISRDSNLNPNILSFFKGTRRKVLEDFLEPLNPDAFAYRFWNLLRREALKTCEDFWRRSARRNRRILKLNGRERESVVDAFDLDREIIRLDLLS